MAEQFEDLRFQGGWLCPGDTECSRQYYRQKGVVQSQKEEN